MLVIAIFSLMTAVALPGIKISPNLLTRITSIIFVYAARLSVNGSYIGSIGSGVGIYSGLFEVSSLSQYFDRFLFIIRAMIFVGWAPVTSKVLRGVQSVFTALPTIPEFSLIILFVTCGGSLLISSADLISMYLSIELQSFSVYILASLYRQSESATAAGLKYFLLGRLASSLILLGSGLIYAYTGLTNFESIFSLLSVGSIDNLTEGLGPCIIGFSILVIGFLFKIAAAPFHNWAPDVYDGTPTIVTTWLTIIPKIAILVFLLSLQRGLEFNGSSLTLVFDGVSFDVWKNLLLISSLLSLIIGTVVGLAQYRIKRLFAYSAISHVGFLLLALAINSEESIESFVFYLVQYTITNLNAFLVLLAYGYMICLSKKSSDIVFIDDLKGQFKSNPLLGLAFTVSLFSMAGVPPLIGFFGKQMVLYSATHRGYYFLSFVAIIVSVISASYYLKIIRVIHFESGNTDNKDITHSSELKLTNVHSFTIATLTMVITLYVFKPSLILNSATLLALTLFNF
ncbi:NADH dehydrogenase subunit 2 (mitochondrion) [Cutaneotrichosporon spelunceum]|uniref:NADH-ubiquinone oxidoreductase chain 2 n=1 Tax=Cutaneotrichosporon spelunceum TaxID=1672016 RepID=A0AAD1UZK5_9TREE|nr:NADH dehydrogenase subunit 2 [Cutaneotrichosporon spelunceum]